MKTWKIFKAGHNPIAYVEVNEKDNRDTAYYALQLVRNHFDDIFISGSQLLADSENKLENISTLELYYPEKFSLNGIEYILERLCCDIWTSEAHGFCKRSDGSECLYVVTFNNKQDLIPISVELPL